MNHHLKSTIFKTLNVFPSSIAFPTYHILQRLLGNNKISAKMGVNKKSYKIISKLLQKVDEDMAEKNILEIGSGWVPVMPYLFKYLGKCNEVHTYDLNEHYQKSSIKELIHYFHIEPKNDHSHPAENKYHLPDWITYKPKENLIHAALPDNIDLIVSRFVLEHVTPQDIFLMHKKFKEKYANNTYVVHLISPSDHRAFSDNSLSLYDFLKYSEQEWNNIQTKFDYHNRLRLPQYLKIFKDVGYEICHVDYSCISTGSEEEIQKFRKIKIHDDFSDYSEEEVTAGGICLIMK